MKKYPTSRPSISKKDIRGVLDVLSTDFLSIGPKHIEFEKKFAKRIGTKYAISVSSGTSGLHLALLASGISKGDEVITTPFSFISSSNAILYCGAKPIFCDVDPKTFNIDHKKIKQLITKKTKAILVVHIFGQSSNMKEIVKLAKKHKLKIIEDACESIDAKHYGKKVGTFGESAIFAFYPNKQMTTGEGGIVVTNKKNIYEMCASLRNQGRSLTDTWLNHKYVGYNYRMDEMSASLGISQLSQLATFIKKRNRIANWYNNALKPIQKSIQIPQTEKHNTNTWFVYVIRITNEKINRNTIIKELAKQGVQSRPYLPSIHLSTAYKKLFNFKKGDFSISEEISSQTIALPLYVQMTKKDVTEISQRLISIIKKYE